MTDKSNAAVAARIQAAQDAVLRKDLDIINTRTRNELGYLPPGGLPIQPKRKPTPYVRPEGSVPPEQAVSAPDVASESR